MLKATFRALLLLCMTAGAFAQTAPIRITVDATDAPRRLFHAKSVIPATPGAMRLAFAKWIPGEHGPSGPIENLANIRVTANGQRVEWRRDPREMTLFHIDVPSGASTIEVETSYLSPTGGGNFTAGINASPNLAVLSWNTLLLYPLGNADDVRVEASLLMPEGWKYGTALSSAREDRNRVDFRPVSVTTLIDSPVLLGRHFTVAAIPPVAGAPVHRIDVAGETRGASEPWPGFAADYSRLVAEAGALFGSYPFSKYDWLVALSDNVAHFGLEHHESSDNRMPEATLTKPGLRRSLASLLAHEYVHSWNGKYRRPAVMLSPDYQQPIQGELLWVYEGLTNYLGYLLAARSGLWSENDWRERVASVAASLDVQPGRAWRPLGDTAVGMLTVFGTPHAWSATRRGVDFYPESILVWLEVDSIIRQKTNGRASLDDFLRRFHGGSNGVPSVKPYTFDDVVNTLNAVAPHDWRAHLNERLWSTSPRAPLAGLTSNGWTLSYSDVVNEAIADESERGDTSNYIFSLGFSLSKDGSVRDVLLGSPAGKAGIGPGMKIIAVNDRRWSREVLDAAVREAKGGTTPIRLLVENADYFRTHEVHWHDGLRYPHLVRDASRPDTLGAVLGRRAK